MSTPPLAIEQQVINNPEIKFKSTEIFDFYIEEKKFILKLSYNNEVLCFNVLEDKSLSLKEYILYQNYEELKKIDKFFILFENIEEIFNSLKRLISENNLSLIKEKDEIKIKIKNSLTNKYFEIYIPQKEKNINNKIDILFNCIITLNKKVNDLEIENINLKNKLDISDKYNKELEKKMNEKIIYLQNQIKDLKNDKESNKKQNIDSNHSNHSNQMFKNSNIVKKEEIDLILSWFDKKPKKFNLLLDSKIDGDLNSTFYEKCKNKYPTMVFVKTSENLRFGGFTSVSWPEHRYNYDDNSFLFSLDKRKKYNIIEKNKAIYFNKNSSFCFGSGCDLYINDRCTSDSDNNVGNGSYDIPSECELNNGKKSFLVSNYEVYHIEYQ